MDRYPPRSDLHPTQGPLLRDITPAQRNEGGTLSPAIPPRDPPSPRTPTLNSHPGNEGPTEIVVVGAREHNLRDLDVRIPREKLVVVTGPSGSGKSSLAFDTLYAEGQRRYVESLSTYGRIFLDQMKKPEVDAIEGLSPAIAIEQKGATRNPRSTVGTVTEIFDFLRLLFARAGQPHCPDCERPITSQTLDEMCEQIYSLSEGSRVAILAPVVRSRRGSYRKELESFRKQGFVRVRIDGEVRDLAGEISLKRQARHDIDVIVDRLQVNARVHARLRESLAMALELADGLARLDLDDGAEPRLLSRRSACAECGVSLPELTPRMLSFNSPQGACPGCNGLGTTSAYDPSRIVPDPERSLAEGAVEPWRGRSEAHHYQRLANSLASHLGVSPDVPWQDLPKAAQQAILHGTGDTPIDFETGAAQGDPISRTWDGVIGELVRREESGARAARGLERYRSESPCKDCHGSRLQPAARHVRLREQSIDRLAALSIADLDAFLADLELPDGAQPIAEPIVVEIRDRLRFLDDVGLDYLSLDRPSTSLSGGEAQRIRLATQIGTSLMGVLYILDEPSIGLHPRDNRRLLDSLLRLRDMGNSVLVVEHDEETIRTADHVVDMGPGAGIHGGAIVAEGPPASLLSDRQSLTGAYLSGRRHIALPEQRRPPPEREIVVAGCREHNLKNIDLHIPVGRFTVVTGVSGSGKSTLVEDTLQRLLASHFHKALAIPGDHESVRGLDFIDKVIAVDQSPIGRSPRSNPATYSGCFDPIRRLFSGVPEARVRGYAPGRFSYNVKGGRCETCDGDGSIRVEMNFLPDLFVTCKQCDGRRYERETLEILYKGRSIADVLEMSVEEALAFFENTSAVKRPLRALADVGLGYLRLGQAASTLSGGEAQRIKLAREFSKRATGGTLFILDEPTTGLHFADVEGLMALLQRLVDLGNTVVVVEHHLDVVKLADHVIDLGPEGGARGGEIVATGTPEEVCNERLSHTGQALRMHMASAQ